MNKILFLTGGSRGIGRSVVLEAVKSGYSVAFTYQSKRELASKVVEECLAIDASKQVRAYKLDVRYSAQVDDVADQVLNDFDGVHAVIVNAGVSRSGLVFSFSDEDWDLVLSTNLTGSFYVCRAFLPEMLANKFGRIVLVSSVTAGGATGQVAYTASKSGLQGLCGTVAREYGSKGITCNVVMPGYFDTDMTRDNPDADIFSFAMDYGPLHRIGTLEELAQSILFLTSDASRYITGESIRIAGGIEWVP
jgi:3-oxoacyl-[acyl-carrier protein] reductase